MSLLKRASFSLIILMKINIFAAFCYEINKHNSGVVFIMLIEDIEEKYC